MMFPRAYTHLLLIPAILLLCSAWSCSNTRKLPKNESLYTGSSVRINDRLATKKERKFLRGELNDAVRPQPNKKLLGMRVKLRLYNFAGELAAQQDRGAAGTDQLGKPAHQ
jgi:hypothetical protein